MKMCICNCGHVFPEDELIVKKYDAGYSEGICPSCGNNDDWEEAKQCFVCGEWHHEDNYTAGCDACSACAEAEYTPELGRKFLVWASDNAVNVEASFYFEHLPYFGHCITNNDALDIVKEGIKATGTNIEPELKKYCLVKHIDEWTEFCVEQIWTKEPDKTDEPKPKHVA